jgi:hypothetical protein
MRELRALAILLLLLGWVRASYGDGGAVLVRQDAGKLTVTVFSTSLPLQAGPADLSVMVQDRESGQILLDPVIDLAVNAQTIRLAPATSGNRLLQSGTVNFPHAGQWTLGIVVTQGANTTHLQAMCSVQAARSRTGIVRFYLLLPAFIILLFFLHQRLKRFEVKAR